MPPPTAPRRESDKHEHYIEGEHATVVASPMVTGWGPTLLVGLIEEAFRSEGPAVLLKVSRETEGGPVDWSIAEDAWLEPEEARLLARRLLQAADKWDALQG